MSTDQPADDDLVADADEYLKQEAAPDQQKQDGGQLALQAMQAIDGLSLRGEDLKLQIGTLRVEAKKRPFVYEGDIQDIRQVEELLETAHQNYLLYRNAIAENRTSGDKEITVLVSSAGEVLDEMPAHEVSVYRYSSVGDMYKRRNKECNKRYPLWEQLTKLHKLSLEAVAAQRKIQVIAVRIAAYRKLIKELTGIELDIPSSPQS